MQDPRIGQRFGAYVVTRKISQGGMGAVYLAEYAGMKKVVKYVLGEVMNIPEIRQRFKDECNAAKRLKGRAGIVEIDEFGERDGELYLLMEHIEGPTLEAHIRQNGRLTEHHTAHVMLLILRALDILHGEGIVHRDLKPSNVFLRDTDERPYDPTLIDFGIVHDKQALGAPEFRTREGQLVGTVGFMATEQYGQAHKASPATDIFACAVMMWLMLTGELPWGLGETEFDQYDRQLNRAPVWPAHIPLAHAPGWKEILIAALAPNPASRPQTAQLFALQIAQHLQGIPPHVPDGLTMVERLARKFLRNLPAEVETVRSPNGKIEVARFWSPRTGGATPVSAGSFNFDAIRVSAVANAPAVSAPTISARPHVAAPVTPAPSAAPAIPATPMPPMTTLSAANGSAFGTPAGPRSRLRTAAVAVGAALAIGGAIGGVTFGVSRLVSRASDTSDSIEPAATPSGSQAAGSSEAVESPAAPSGLHAAGRPDAGEPTTAVGGSASPAPTPSTLDATPESDTKPAKPPESEREATGANTTTSTSQRHTKHTRPTPTRAIKSKTNGDHESASATHSAPTTTSSGSASAPRAGSDTFDPDAIKE